jgi:type IV secretory pathway TrbF-like protein
VNAILLVSSLSQRSFAVARWVHAATRAGALDSAGREALLRYVLRPPVAQERVEQRPDGLVRIR